MKVIIVDDEPKAIELLSGYLKHFEEIEIAGTFRNGLKAFEFLTRNSIDLIFLDISMPHISGISLSKMISPSQKIIFTTAYSEYAVESYDIEAVDYLLKPISLERFAKAIRKVQEIRMAPGSEANVSKLMLLKSGDTNHRIHTKDILYLKKDGNYMNYFFQSKKILTRESVNEALQNLPSNFLQVHKSFIINTDQITSIKKDSIIIAEHTIPIGMVYKEQILKIVST